MIGPFENEYEFLSNFYPCEVEYDGVIYPSVEHCYQAQKTALLKIPFADPSLTAAKAKKMGRKLILRSDWEDVKLTVMERCLRIKFSNPQLGFKLIQTGNEELVEVNWWNDRFYGVCNGQGENWLGKLLMKMRSEL